MNIKLIYFFIYFSSINFYDCKKYYNYTLFRGIPVENVHLEFFKNLTAADYVNFWRSPGQLFKPADFIVDPEYKEKFQKDADNLGLYITTIKEDVQQAFDKQTVKTYIRRQMESFDWNSYFRLDDIYQWLRDMAKNFPEEMEIISIGTTHERREILAVKILLKHSTIRSKVIVEGGIHAREWISPAFVTYFINKIIHAPVSNDPILKNIALTYEWYFIPVLNADGYEYSHTHDRLWRKNRNARGSVDLNRNFDHAFGTVGVSSAPNSPTFCGPKAFSELETQAMADFIQSKGLHLEYYFSFHSYGQYMILPYANLKTHSENYGEVYKMCLEAKSKIARRFNIKYSIGTAYDTVGYLTSGVSSCWVKSKLRVPYVVTFELRDSGNDGFALHPSKILPTCQETMDGIISLLTPRTTAYAKLHGEHIDSDAAVSQFFNRHLLDKIVLGFNVLLFITVRFD